MIQKDDILGLLHGIQHPELRADLVTAGLIDNLQVTPDKIQFTLLTKRGRDPFATALKKQAEEQIVSRYPAYTGKVTIFIKEGGQASKKNIGEGDLLHAPRAKNTIAVSSAKGGVGKSTVTANLALALARMNYRVGILDADIYGPSQPMLFGIEDYKPVGHTVEGRELIVPADADGIRIMSIGFFIEPTDALIWRGPMATNALKQMIQQTDWGELDFLLVDFPPGTGDVHLTLVGELDITGAVIVSTPQEIALADVRRGLSMFRAEHVNIPVLGLVENMSWFTPAEHPDERYYIFGEGGAKKLAEEENLKLLGEIPLVMPAGKNEPGKNGLAFSNKTGVDNPVLADIYTDIAGNLVHQAEKKQH